MTQDIQYVWLIGSLILLGCWLVLFTLLRDARGKREMLKVSFWTGLLGITEPIFVPAYWNPPSLFDLAQKSGFDIESFIFAFAVGGIAAVIYEGVFRVRHEKMAFEEKRRPRHRFHVLALLSAPLIFAILFSFTDLNPIYSVIFSLLGGGIFALYCRPDLKIKMLASALIFLAIYFFGFLLLVRVWPTYVAQVWNLSAISGILILGIPLEELLFALSLGFLWSSVYEHFKWYKIKL